MPQSLLDDWSTTRRTPLGLWQLYTPRMIQGFPVRSYSTGLDKFPVLSTCFLNSQDHPFSLQEYYASCHKNGSLTLLFLPISRHSQNVLGAAGHSASISVTAEVPAARHARVSLMGNITVFNDGSSAPNVESLRRCYLKRHPDAKWWLPDDKDGAHIAYWARFDPHSIYFVGGFGGRHYIGYIPLSLYQAASEVIENNPRTAENVLFEQL